MTTGRFQEAKFHWQLSGNQSWKVTVASVPVAVIPANAGIQWRLSKDAGFRVPLRGPGMTFPGRQGELANGRFVESRFKKSGFG